MVQRKKNKRNSNQESLGEVIDRMLNVYRLKSGLTELELKDKWSSVVGPHIASRTSNLRIFGQKLVIYVDSAALKQELFYQKSGILQNVNEYFGEDAITEKEIR